MQRFFRSAVDDDDDDDDDAAPPRDLRRLEGASLLLPNALSNVSGMRAKRRPRCSPMRTLPPELCNIIFEYGTYTECTQACLLAGKLDSPPVVVLACVCKRWRDIVLANPALWSRVHISPLMGDISCARLWFTRSADMPLSITVCGGWEALVVPQHIAILAPYLHRIKSLDTCIGPDAMELLFPAGKLTEMPLIEDLFLRAHKHPSNALLGPLYAPRLHTLRLHKLDPLANVLAPFVLPRVRHLFIHPEVAREPGWDFRAPSLDLLARCTRLQTLSIVFNHPRCYLGLRTIQDHASPPLPVEFPALCSLALACPNQVSHYIRPFLRLLRAPRLRDLRLSASPYQRTYGPQALPREVFTALCALVRSAGESLTELTLEGLDLEAEDIADCAALLGECDALERLSVIDCRRADRLLVPLTPPANGAASWICPRLTHVALSRLRDTGAGCVVEFVRSRCPQPVPPATERVYLEELVLDMDIHALPHDAQAFLLSELIDLRGFVRVVRPCIQVV